MWSGQDRTAQQHQHHLGCQPGAEVLENWHSQNFHLQLSFILASLLHKLVIYVPLITDQTSPTSLDPGGTKIVSVTK